jgi:hypothetical protein
LGFQILGLLSDGVNNIMQWRVIEIQQGDTSADIEVQINVILQFYFRAWKSRGHVKVLKL